MDMYDNLVLYDIVGGGRWRSGFSGVLVIFWRRGLAGCHVFTVNWNFLDFSVSQGHRGSLGFGLWV